MLENFTPAELKLFESRIYMLLAFICMSVGAWTIHHGLVGIILGFYILKITGQIESLVNVFISIPNLSINQIEPQDDLKSDLEDMLDINDKM